MMPCINLFMTFAASNTWQEKDSMSLPCLFHFRVAMTGDSPVGGIDCGEMAARWLERFLGHAKTRLVLISPDVALRHMTRKTEQGHTETYNVFLFSLWCSRKCNKYET